MIELTWICRGVRELKYNPHHTNVNPSFAKHLRYAQLICYGAIILMVSLVLKRTYEGQSQEYSVIGEYRHQTVVNPVPLHNG